MAVNRTIAQQVLDILGNKYSWKYEGGRTCIALLIKKDGIRKKVVGKLEYLSTFHLWINDEEVAEKLKSLPINIWITPYFC